jgi:geranylgeranyl diphosphate synthase type I
VADPGDVVARVEGALKLFLDGRCEALARVGDDLEPVASAAADFVLTGGKRLRPTFAYWGWRTTRGAEDDAQALITAAASLELLHASALVHDDVMDDSDTRRGRPAAHRAFARLHAEHHWLGDSRSFGTSAAILLGDLLLCWSDQMFGSAGVGPQAHQVYLRMREEVMAGQYLDLLEQARGRTSVDAALRVAEFKTSRYSVEQPLQLGAAAAGAPEATREALHRYGMALGEAFQLRDDVLGVFGDSSRTGKPTGDDLREGKRTLLAALAAQRADPEQAAVLRQGLGDRSLDSSGARRLAEVIVETGALASVEVRIAARASEARAALQEPAISPPARAALTDLVSVATDRAS